MNESKRTKKDNAEANGELTPIKESPAHYSRPPYGSLAALQYPRLGASSSDRFSGGDYSLDGASLEEPSTFDSLDGASSMSEPRDSRRERKPKKRFWCWLKKKRSPEDHPN